MTATPSALAVGPELTIAHAAQWHATLLGHVADIGGDVQVDLATVTDFDSAGVQLLLAVRASLRERGDSLHVARVSAPVQDALTLFGLHDLLPAPA
jgi:anti-anti-sigma factor